MPHTLTRNQPDTFGGDLIDGTLGHAVLALGPGEHGEPEIALWTTSPTGVPTGAWVHDHAATLADPALAATVLGLTTGRATIGWDADATAELLRLLEKAAGQPPSDWSARMLPLTAFLPEIQRHRDTVTDAFTRHAATTKSKLVPLEWRRAVPTVDTLAELAAISAVLRPPARSEAVAETLHLVNLVRWVAGLWDEVEDARSRRRYLDTLGPAQILPPGWLAALQHAYTV